jgi:hypothetical protein
MLKITIDKNLRITQTGRGTLKQQMKELEALRRFMQERAVEMAELAGDILNTDQKILDDNAVLRRQIAQRDKALNAATEQLKRQKGA